MADSRKKQPDLLRALLDHWPAALAGASLEVGLSGGLDSMTLLDLLWRCREQRHFHLSAVHVHHGLSGHAEAWVEHCRAWCERYRVPLRVARVNVRCAGGDSLEAVARDERYRVYDASQADAIVLAHHQDDQSETVLLQLLRGGGPHALAAMPALRRRGRHWLWRPLLAWPRPVLEAYARERGLAWVDDESNADTRWRRNLLRHDVLPLIADAVPSYRRHLARSAALMAQAARILDEVADQDLAHCLADGKLLLSRFAELGPDRRQQALVRWLKRLDAGEASPEAVADFCHQLLSAAPDRHPELRLPALLLFRYRDQVWCERSRTAVPEAETLPWLPAGYRLPQWGGALRFDPAPGGLDPARLADGVQLRPRTGGERLALPVGHKPVKTLLQEAGIPPRLRQRWPLLYLADGRLAAVPSVAVAVDCRAADGLWPQWTVG